MYGVVYTPPPRATGKLVMSFSLNIIGQNLSTLSKVFKSNWFQVIVKIPPNFQMIYLKKSKPNRFKVSL